MEEELQNAKSLSSETTEKLTQLTASNTHKEEHLQNLMVHIILMFTILEYTFEIPQSEKFTLQ